MTITHNFARKSRIKPQLVLVAGHYGAPWIGLKASPERTLKDGSRVIEVVTVRHNSACPPRRVTVETSLVKPLHLYACPQGVLENLAKCGALTVGEYTRLLAERLAMIEDAEDRVGICRGSRRRREVTPWHNLGKGHVTREARRFIR